MKQMIEELNKGRIIPGESIGEIHIGETEEELLSQIGTEYRKQTRENDIKYYVNSVTIWVKRKVKRVYQVMVEEGFKGKLFDRYGIGTPFPELRKLGEVYQELDTYMIKGLDGICFEMSEDETSEDDYDVENTHVEYISVF